MSKAPTPEQVSAALRFYAVALGPPGKPKPWPDCQMPAAPTVAAPPTKSKPKERQ